MTPNPKRNSCSKSNPTEGRDRSSRDARKLDWSPLYCSSTTCRLAECIRGFPLPCRLRCGTLDRTVHAHRSACALNGSTFGKLKPPQSKSRPRWPGSHFTARKPIELSGLSSITRSGLFTHHYTGLGPQVAASVGSSGVS